MLDALWALTMSFAKIGLVSLGGGNSMLKLIEYEAVTSRHWVGSEEFINMLGSGFLFPGLTAVKLSALIGYKVCGIPGLLAAVLALNIPGLVMTTIGYRWLTSHDGPVTHRIMTAVQYGAVALLAAATWSIGQGIVSLNFSVLLAVASVVFFAALAFLQVSPFWGFLAFVGVAFFLVRP